MSNLILQMIEAANRRSLDKGVLFEEVVKLAYQDILLPGDKVIDIGANVGFHLIPMARAVGRKGRVYALNQLLKRGKRSDNINKTIMIKPKEKITYKRSFDLTEFRTEIADKTFVEFRAHFRYILNNDRQEESKWLESNKAKYFL